MIGVSRQTIYNYENDITYPNSVDLKKICNALGCSYLYLLDDENNSQPNQTTNKSSEVDGLIRGVKKHWRKIYICFFIVSGAFLLIGIFGLVSNNLLFNNAASMMPSFGNDQFQSMNNSSKNIFNLMSYIIIGISIILFIVGFIFLILDIKHQKKNK